MSPDEFYKRIQKDHKAIQERLKKHRQSEIYRMKLQHIRIVKKYNDLNSHKPSPSVITNVTYPKKVINKGPVAVDKFMQLAPRVRIYTCINFYNLDELT